MAIGVLGLKVSQTQRVQAQALHTPRQGDAVWPVVERPGLIFWSCPLATHALRSLGFRGHEFSLLGKGAQRYSESR